MMSEIDKSRNERLRACEKALAEHMEEVIKGGLAVKEIRDDKMYQEDGFKTFEDYCKGKWGITKQRSYQLMDASELRLKLPTLPEPNESQQPVDSSWNESQMRQLGRLGSDSKAKAVA